MEKDNQDLFDETEPEESFEELLNQSLVKPVRLNPGDQVKAVITHITKEWVFIGLGGKTEGYIESNEFLDDKGQLTVQEGETINAFFLASRSGEKLFTTRLSGDTTGGGKHLEEAWRNQIPVEGLVEKEIKGGFEVKIAGTIRAFCPFSQMGLRRPESNDAFIGQHMTFLITQYDEKGRNIVVSNRRILEAELQKQKDALRETLQEGMTVEGKITSIRDFGAFVDIGGIEGLLPISEISWGRVEDINSLLSVGQKVDVSIKKLDWGNNKFSFSLKEIQPNPWNNIALRYPEGSTHTGQVSRFAPFGAFVTLEPGVDGLVHISALSKTKRVNHPREVLEENQTVQVKILKVNEGEKRLSLEMVSGDQETTPEDDYKTYLGTNSRSSSKSFGTLGDAFRAKKDKK
jgi:small subunit ribosomal protein S1